MFVNSNEFFLLQGSTLQCAQSSPLTESYIETEFFALLEAGVNRAPGALNSKINKDGKKYIERVDAMLKKIDKDPEAVLNSQEFIDLVQNFDKSDVAVRNARAKMLGVTDEQIKPTDIRIFNRIRKGDNMFTAIQEEYSKTFDRFDTAFDDNGASLLALVAVNIVNSVVIGIMIAKFGQHIGFLLAATLCAPITEEIGRQIVGNTGKRSFSYGINIMEYLQYALQSLSMGGALMALVTIVWRTLFSTNLHQINETHIHSEKLQKIITGQITRGSLSTASGWTLAGNMTRHALANGLSFIFQPLLLIWELVCGQFRNEDYTSITEAMSEAMSTQNTPLFEGVSIMTSAGIEIDLI